MACIALGGKCDGGAYMGNTVGYMVTWGMYGTWLQGDERGYVKNGKHLGRDDALCEANRNNLRGCAVYLTDEQRKPVERTIVAEGQRAGEKIEAIAVCSDHVHVVVRHTGKNMGEFVGRSKAAGRKVLRGMGFCGKVWARGYDKRFCFDEDAIKQRIAYVEGHGGE